MEVFLDQVPAGNHVSQAEDPEKAEQDLPGYREEAWEAITLELVAIVPLLVQEDQFALSIDVKDGLVV